ncbi:hypothetical protein AgCh_017563 [Apium graveolens]
MGRLRRRNGANSGIFQKGPERPLSNAERRRKLSARSAMLSARSAMLSGRAGRFGDVFKREDCGPSQGVTTNFDSSTCPVPKNPLPLAPSSIITAVPCSPPTTLPPATQNVPLSQHPSTPLTSPQTTTNTTSSPTSPSITSASPQITKSPPPAINSLPPRVRTRNPKYYNDKFINVTTNHPMHVALEPSTVAQAMKDPLWRKAMDDEYNALIQNGTWELIPRSNHVPISCKWVFRVKRKPDGSLEKYKACLVTKGFLQQPGRDFVDTFSPVIKPATIRIVLCIALSRNWQLRQLDINNAFLHGTLHEDVYMLQPPGYIDTQHPHYICKLKKAIYGLRQASRAWYKELKAFLLDIGFRHSLADTCLFIYDRDGVQVFFMVYVDDIILTGNNNIFVNDFVSQLARRFSIKDLGSLHHFLGVEVISTKMGLLLSQHRYIVDLLDQFHMTGAKEVSTPLNISEVLTLVDGSRPIDATPYHKLIGSLQYLAITRPDVSFAINKLSQSMHSPTEIHWQAVKRVLRYLKGTLHHGLFLTRNSPLTLTAFSDSDWGGVHDQGRSTTAYVLYLGPNIISWRSARQKSVSRSSTEAEYKALANAATEIMWVQNILNELRVFIPRSPTLFCDNTGDVYSCANLVYHSRMKHLAFDYHFVRERVTCGLLHVFHVSSKD